MVIYILKKLITVSLIPPGIFIICLLIIASFAKKRVRLMAIVCAILIYVLSIEPTKDRILIPLEDAYNTPTLKEIEACNAYVVLGGGLYDNAPDLTGKGIPTAIAFTRIVDAARLYSLIKRPIIFSGGKVFNRRSESEVAKRILCSLGVKEKDIILEDRSTDTIENAEYVKEKAGPLNLKRIVLITSAFHMKRAMMLFKRHFEDITPYPAGYRTARAEYDVLSFLPSASNLYDISLALKEYMGIIFYKIA